MRPLSRMLVSRTTRTGSAACLCGAADFAQLLIDQPLDLRRIGGRVALLDVAHGFAKHLSDDSLLDEARQVTFTAAAGGEEGAQSRVGLARHLQAPAGLLIHPDIS